MGDMGDDWKDVLKERQEKRARNRDASARLLQEAGIPFESRNDGTHLIVAGRYDFWPGTGLWMARGEKTKRRGVHALIERIRRG